jgi:REP element-mobilizing transposase RayT
MSHTYTKLTTHCVFGTRDRIPLIKDAFKDRLYGYMASIVNRKFGFSRRIGGMPDHVHMLFDLRPDVALSDCMRDVKGLSSRFVRQEIHGMKHFGWQEGYGGFSVSASVVRKVIEYIEGQVEHHKARSFEEEFKKLLDRYGIEYEERYLWK